MEELSRSHIVSRGDELGEMPNVDICGTFFKELFDNIDTETETEESPSKDSEAKANDDKSFDICEDENPKKKLASKRKQLKGEGKGNRPNRADPLDESHI